MEGGERRGVHRVLVGKPKGKRPLGIDRRITLSLIFRIWDMGGIMDWNVLAQDRDKGRALVTAVMNLRVPQETENFFTS
jgi:hypothetical protein